MIVCSHVHIHMHCSAGALDQLLGNTKPVSATAPNIRLLLSIVCREPRIQPILTILALPFERFICEVLLMLRARASSSGNCGLTNMSGDEAAPLL